MALGIRFRLTPRAIGFLAASFRYLLGVLALILFTIGYFAFIQPRWDAVRTTSVAEVRALEQKRTQRRSYLDKLRALNERFTTVQLQHAMDIAKLQEIIPREEDIPKLMVQLDALAKDHALSLDAMTIVKQAVASPVVAPGGTEGAAASRAIKNLQVTLTLSQGTTYDQFKEFLGGIEAHVRLFDVLQLQYAPAAQAEGAQPGGDRYGVTLETYYQG